MTKKSAASVKAKKQPTADEKWAELKTLFDDSKWAFKETVKTQITLSRRIDNMLNLRDMVKSYGMEPTIPLLKDLVDHSNRCYVSLLARVETFEFDDFMAEEMKDYFEGLVPYPDDIVDDMDLLYAAVAFLSVKPYGSKMLQMHQMLQQKKTELGL